MLSMLTRRNFCSICAAALALAIGMPQALAQNKVKVAAVYTVPIEQQWVSRIHKALNAAKDRGEIEYVYSEKVANADYERVMREYAEKGNTFIVGRVVRRRARRAQGREGLPQGVVPDGIVGQAAGAQLRGVRQLHPGVRVPDRHGRGRHDQDQQDRHGRRLPDPGSEPSDARVHGGRQGNESEGRVLRHVSSARGSIRRRRRKPPSR
jgi:hypothetical protein